MIKGIVVNPTRLKVKGGLKAQKEFRASCADELREFLQDKKYRYIKTDELRNFYSERFPKLNIGITNKRHRFPLMGTAEQHFDKKTLKMTDCEIKIASSSPIDKVLGLFGYKPHKDEFYVDNKFTEVLVHESTHMWQHFLKSTHSVYLKELDKIFNGNRPKLLNQVDKRDKLYHAIVYNEFMFPPTVSEFRKALKLGLDSISSKNDRLKLANLKSLIRDLENEKEAYEVCSKQLLYYRNPASVGNKEYSKYADKKAAADSNGRFDFDAKLEVMKKMYFNLAKSLREELKS